LVIHPGSGYPVSSTIIWIAPKENNMDLSIRRIIIFTGRIDAMAAFYREVLGLEQIADETGWKEFQAGRCNIALHNGTSIVGKRAPKLAFYSGDVRSTRDALLRRGAPMGKLKSGSGLDLCEGKDPDGNPFQISNRK
jgi:catechol 2,3-dioxygenase-like lactoylglutathione lyase family enzyme